ncbi:UNVERIFIED_CONTAM: cytochrome [Sesamum angustifolium]|uniref:Cytochrome n=1 Tax=Sesamum angustifolium TaxID=2727405 RepID=A0AAW2PFV1_9LAMI
MHDFCFTIPYGLLLVLGGVVGYAKKGSTASLAGGLGTGLLLVLAGYLSLQAFHKHKNSYFALILETAVAAILTWIMGQRYMQTGKIMPPGIVAGISLAMTVFYIYKIATGGNHIPPKTERRRLPLKRLPPGSLGIPVIGQSLGLLWAMRANTAERWIADRAKKYGPISKMSLFGKPTVFIHGQAANKLVFTSDASKMSNHQTESMKRILGDCSLLELSGEEHMRLRKALASFLKPDSLKNYVGKMEEEIRLHLLMHWRGKQKVAVLPLMRTLTFNIICSLIFGVERGARRDSFIQNFQHIMGGVWSFPVNLPFTRFNRSLKASAEVQRMLKQLISEKRNELENGALSHQDLITCLLSLRGEEDQELLSEDEIIHNIVLIMVAGHDTSSILITFIMQILANDPSIHAAVLAEQEEVKRASPLESC